MCGLCRLLRQPSIDVDCNELLDCAWNVGLYHRSYECVYVYCVEIFAHIEYYSDYSRRGSIWLNPFATVF